MAGGAALGLSFASKSAPPGGEALYLTLLQLLILTGIVASPLLLSAESVLATRRMEMVPISAITRWLSRALLGNPLRTALALVLIGWGTWVATRSGAPVASALRSFQLVGWIFAALGLSQLMEDVIRHRRAVVLHQLIFLAGLALWPAALAFLRDEDNFLPPPQWTQVGYARALLMVGEAPLRVLLAGAVVPWSFGLLLVWADRVFLARTEGRAPPPSAGVAWTGAMARFLSGGRTGSILLYKEILVPLRFLFVRMSLVFLFLTFVAAFASGVPYLLLGIAFWWQPLSTNALGPDLHGGTTRYELSSLDLPQILRRRMLATIILTVAIAALALVVCLALGIVESPRMGPPTRWMYLVLFGYSLSLLPLWAIAGDRYSLRYSDPLEMSTLLPERSESAGAAAVVLIFLMWGAITALAAVLGVLALGGVVLLLPGPLEAPRLAVAAAVAASAHGVAYRLHYRHLAAGTI